MIASDGIWEVLENSDVSIHGFFDIKGHQNHKKRCRKRLRKVLRQTDGKVPRKMEWRVDDRRHYIHHTAHALICIL
jgi:uncharacterized protein YdaU (DUF1376 family)